LRKGKDLDFVKVKVTDRRTDHIWSGKIRGRLELFCRGGSCGDGRIALVELDMDAADYHPIFKPP